MANSIPCGQVDGEQLLDLDMKKFRQEKQPLRSPTRRVLSQRNAKLLPVVAYRVIFLTALN